jgi:hypothetical protein
VPPARRRLRAQVRTPPGVGAVGDGPRDGQTPDPTGTPTTQPNPRLDTASAHKDWAPTRTTARTRRVLGSARALTHPDHVTVQQTNLASVRSVPRALS